ESILKKNVFHLSFGQKKLVSIATVTAMDARVLVFDQPTAGLDPRARKKIISLLRSLGRTQIIASHDLDLLSQLCDRVVLLSGGAVAAEGKTSDILNDISLLEKSGVL
nr:energy-coupling factor ABC transporter ATP-binding protein [bacterium]